MVDQGSKFVCSGPPYFPWQAEEGKRSAKERRNLTFHHLMVLFHLGKLHFFPLDLCVCGCHSQVVKTPANTQHWAKRTGTPVLAYSLRMWVLPSQCIGDVPRS